MSTTILQGNCIDTLKTLDPGIVQTCVTSPPYYGLRDYGLPPSIWGGDPGCKHEWIEHVKPAANGILHDGGMSGETLSGNSGTRKPHKSGFCSKCGAWLGCFGLEPTPELYVAHTVLIFREVWRVLADDGTLWLNLGDSYNGSGGAGGDYAAGGLKEGQPKYPGRKVKGLKPKDLIGIPWMVAFALRADGWYLRSDIIWHKPNPMPESVTDRPTKAHEYMFLLSKSAKYYYDADAIRMPIKDSSAARLNQDVKSQEGSARANGGTRPSRKMKAVAHKNLQYDGQHPHTMHINRALGKEWTPKQGEGGNGFKGHSGNTLSDGRVLTTANKKTVWSVATRPYKEAHFATYPPALIEPCILAGSREGDTVLDPFNGSGTTGEVAIKHGRNYIGCELNPEYIELTNRRFTKTQPFLLGVSQSAE